VAMAAHPRIVLHVDPDHLSSRVCAALEELNVRWVLAGQAIQSWRWSAWHGVIAPTRQVPQWSMVAYGQLIPQRRLAFRAWRRARESEAA